MATITLTLEHNHARDVVVALILAMNELDRAGYSEYSSDLSKLCNLLRKELQPGEATSSGNVETKQTIIPSVSCKTCGGKMIMIPR